MSTEYQKFCERLKEERVRTSLSQMEISRLLRMTQSHYSKAELGKRRLSYYEIQCLCETNVDVYYIFTGERWKQIENDSFFWKSTVEELKSYLEIVCTLYMSLFKANILTLSSDNYKKIENIWYALMPCEKGKTIFYKLRRALNFNQRRMAELIEVDVKKLRGMESGKILPDSEIMCQMMNVFSIPYALFLNDKNGLICEISCLLEFMGGEKQSNVLEGIKFIHKTFWQDNIREIY